MPSSKRKRHPTTLRNENNLNWYWIDDSRVLNKSPSRNDDVVAIENAKPFFDDAARDMKELLESLQKIYTEADNEPQDSSYMHTLPYVSTMI